MCFDDPELLKEFVVESLEHLSNVENELLSLEESAGDVDIALVNKVFRSVHSIKGAAGFLGLKVLETLAHREEEVLDRLRNNSIRPTNLVINTLLKATDRLKDLLDSIESSNDQDVSENVRALEQLMAIGNEPELATSADVSLQQANCNIPIANRNAPCKESSSSSIAETLREFLVESHDGLNQIERDVVLLEKDPGNDAIINNIFRNVHTIKGTTGFLAFHHMEKLTHAGENLLGALRNGQILLDREIVGALLSLIDSLRGYLDTVEVQGSDGSVSCDAEAAKLNQLLQNRLNITTSCVAQEASVVTQTIAPVQAVVKEPETRTVSSFQTTEKQEFSASPSPKVPSPTTEKASAIATQDTNGSSSVDSTIRVDVAILDKLMTRVGELVLARNQIIQFTNMLGNSDLVSTTQRLNLITTELQEGVMKTRMQQIGNVWAKFPRMVRDLAAICGKEVRIEMEGKETELDKTIIESIKDPLTHLVRNTVDHGIEKPGVRIQNGKPSEGCLFLRAFHEGGQVNIEISDDGAGLNLERIKEKAVEKGLISQEQASKLAERETCQLIFLPGFSTAETVSNVSGRGVGMDVVKTNIEKIGGTVDLQSVRGVGTTIKIKIPLTLAIIPALVVSNDGSRFAIPQVNLLELVRLEGEQEKNSIEWLQGTPVYRLRGRLLPLVYLRNVLNTKVKEGGCSDVINIVVLRADDRQFGLVVERINDTEEIVVKPLGSQLKNVPVYSGATIMGDGKVALILDVLGIAHKANVVAKDRSRSMHETSKSTKENTGCTQTLLILSTGSERRLAIPISQVARLEKIPTDTIEYAENSEVVQYRGEILPLVRLADILGIEETLEPDDGLLNVIVYIEDNQSYGLVVHRIVDIVETAIELKQQSKRRGLLGSAIIQDFVTDYVDLPSIIKQIEVNITNLTPSN